MSITICRVDNLFWHNNSYKAPNCAPTFVETMELKQRPVIYGFMGGRTHAYGDQWNYAIYKGNYYFLLVDKCIDLEKKHYSYVMVRDMWVNILLRYNVEVNGFLTTTNRDSWILANLNRCHPILTQPCNVARLSLIEEEQTLADAAVVKSTKILSLPLFDIRELREFKEKWNIAAKKYKKQIELGKYKAGSSPIFVFAELKGKDVDTVHCWKEYLRIKLNEFLDDIGKQDLVISKVQNTEGAGRLKEHYCITWNKGGIGTGVENVVIDLIDIGGLEDIVHINPKTLEEGAPTKVIEEKVFEDIEFQFYESQEKTFGGELATRKFRRKIYFPITQDPNRAGISLAPHYINSGYEDNPVLENRVNWQWLNPQHVKLKETGVKEIFLFWIDNADFALNYSEGIISYIRFGGEHDPGEYYDLSSLLYKEFFRSVWRITELPDDFKIPYPFHSTLGDTYADWFFNHHLITPIGFLIFKPFNPRYLDGYIWRGDSTNKLHYISGIRRTRLEQIENGKVFNDIKDMNELPYPIDDYYAFRDSPTNSNWNRYHFNILNGLDILLQPNMKGYKSEWRTWRPNDKTSNNYSLRYLQHDQAPWLNNKAPFYSKERHQSSNERSRRLVDWLVMKTLMELPVTLENGDYLFNDLEYWLDDYDTKIWTDTDGYVYRGLTLRQESVLDKLFRIEDYVKQPKAIDATGNNSVVICSNREGDIEIRQCIKFSRIHRLHSDIYSANLADTRTDIDGLEGFGGSREAKLATLSYSTNDLTQREQAIETVNGQTMARVGYMALKKMDRGTIEKIEEPLAPELTKAIIAAFLKSNGYKLSPDNQSVLYFQRKDFDEAVDLFFDLKGTDWYLHIKSGRISLIAKKPELFKGKESKVSKLKEEASLKELSVIEKVNQKCVLNVYTQQRLLNTRFNFDNDKLNVSVKSIKPAHKLNPTNYYQMNLRSDYDVIEREILAIQKKQLEETATIVDYTQLEALRVQMRRNDRDYDIQMAKDVMFATEKENEKYRRNKWDLDTERMKYWLNQGTNLATLGLTGLGLPGLPGAVGQTLNSIAGLAGAAKDMKIKATALTAIRGMKSVTHNIGGAIIESQILEEKGRRMERDRQFAFKEIAFRSLDIDLRHRDKQEDTIRELNRIGNVYSRGTINDIDIIDEFNKENKLGAINLTVFTPSKEQLKVLNEIKEEYGVDCDIPNATIEIREGMPEDVVRFRHLEDEGLKGIDNAVEREWLMARLEMGIKVVDVCEGFRKRERREKELYSCANVYELTKEIENQRIISGSSGKIERELRDEISNLKEQINAKATDIDNKQHLIDQLNAQSDKDKAELDKRAATIAEKESELQKLRELNEGHENDKKALKEKEAQLAEEIRKHKVDFEDLTQQLNNERIKALNLTDQVNGLKKDKDTLTKQVEDLQKQLADVKKPNGKKPATIPGECELMRQMLADPYKFELKTRENGWNAFLDLIFELAHALKWKDISGIDQRLIGEPQLREMLEKLEELVNIPIIDKAFETIKEPGWGKYVEWLKSGGDKNGSVDKVISKVNQIKLMETMPTVHAVKALLDELNWLSYKAKYALAEPLKTNRDLQTLFAHVYPGKALELYKELFGDPNTAIIRKRYTEKVKCTPDGTESAIQILSNYKKNVSHTISDIPVPPTPDSTPAKPTEEAKPVTPERDPVPPPKPFGWKYYGHELIIYDQATEHWMWSPVQYFEDTYKTKDWSVNSIGGYGFSLFRGNPGMLCIWFWKYPYYKQANFRWDKDKNHRLVWFGKKWSNANGAPQEHYGHYMEAVYYPTGSAWKDIWKNREQLIIPQDMLEAIKLGRRKIKIRFKNLETGNYEIVRYSENFDWEDGKVEIPEEYLPDFIKAVFILHYLYIAPYDAGNVDGYKVYGWDGGGLMRYYLENGRWEHSTLEQRIAWINDKISRIKDNVIDLELGWLFNKHPSGAKDLPNGHAYVYLYFYRWFRRIATTPGYNSTPWQAGYSNYTSKMFANLDEIRRAS